MNERDVTRRSFVSVVAASALPLVPQSADSGAARLTVVCVGGHPDDPESGCGGTLAPYAALGHAVTVVYLTRVEPGISGKSLDHVDISPVVEQKKAALFAHASQDGRSIWREHHEIMAQWRGREVGVPAAEAFVHLNRVTHAGDLPGV